MNKYTAKQLSKLKRAELQELFKECGLEFDDALTNSQLREKLLQVEVEDEKVNQDEQPTEKVPAEEPAKEEVQTEEVPAEEPAETEQPTEEVPAEKPANNLVRNLLHQRRTKFNERTRPTSVSHEIRKRRTGQPAGLSLKEIIEQRRLKK